MIPNKTSVINNLIEKENLLINQYEQYLKTVENTPKYDTIKELIERHNNHIWTLQKLLRR
ncbi:MULTISPECIES: hypothetical protein [Clostridium]|uniref:hypothetical protein n=1 Tax=Clostridium TaxID=1485 RepID=UPI0002EDD106|nr:MULTISPECIES: hypothetical protein [Clostridium]